MHARYGKNVEIKSVTGGWNLYHNESTLVGEKEKVKINK